MDQDDPEKGVADQEQICEQRRGADLPIAPDRPQTGAISNLDPIRRRFVVSVQPKAWQRYLAIGLLFVAAWVFSRIFHTHHGGMGGHLLMLLGFAILWGLIIQWVFIGRKVVIRVTADGLLISKRRGVIFSFREAELGQWRKTGNRVGPYVGRALFLTSGPHRFVLGDLKSPGVASHVPVEGPQVQHQDLDAWTTKSSAFDELLAVIGSARGQ